MKNLVDFIELQFKDMPEFNKLDAETQSKLVILGAVISATAVCDKFFRLLAEYQEKLK